MRIIKIEKVGRYIKIPPDAYEINLEGANVYVIDDKENTNNMTDDIRDALHTV